MHVLVELNHPERFRSNHGDELEHGRVGGSWKRIIHLTVVSLECVVVGAIDHVIRHDTATCCHGANVSQVRVVLLHPEDFLEIVPEFVELGLGVTFGEDRANESSNCSRYIVDRDQRDKVDKAVLVHQHRDDVFVDV